MSDQERFLGREVCKSIVFALESIIMKGIHNKAYNNEDAVLHLGKHLHT